MRNKLLFNVKNTIISNYSDRHIGQCIVSLELNKQRDAGDFLLLNEYR